ncbi:MAG: carboxylating nicotinate-nucleotide diphosphorylase [Dehalococcoidia bacterium]|nr:MAG: carboxylating nicotinate-nucleotide diphosphorylase [Dehalococcoidia bacterium]
MNTERNKGIERIVDIALEEDLSQGDLTTEALIPPGEQGRGYIVAKGEGILAGLNTASMVFQKVDANLKVTELYSDGDMICTGDRLAVIEGNIGGILRAERTALNFLQRLSGLATATARFVEAVSKTKAVIKDTRKTTPGLRLLEKYAVVVGGGQNHRINLGSSILIKDNHLAVTDRRGLGIEEAVRIARERYPDKQIEIEVESIVQAKAAVDAGVDVIMMDNMSLEEMKQVVEIAHGSAMTEASGGINLSDVADVAETGVDFISVGALTHSVEALDISLEIET